MNAKVLRRLAPALIAAGLVLATLGGSQQVRPVSNQPGQIQHNQRLDPTESLQTELLQILSNYDACADLGETDPTVWTTWPCNQWQPPQLPR